MTIKSVLRVFVIVAVVVLAVVIGAGVASAQDDGHAGGAGLEEFYVAIDFTGGGSYELPARGTYGLFCLPGFECSGGVQRWETNLPLETVRFEDGSGIVSVPSLGISATFCLNGYECGSEPLPNPCEEGPDAVSCVPTEEPIIIAPPCNSEWCGFLFLPMIASQYETVLGDGGAPVCSEPDCTQ